MTSPARALLDHAATASWRELERAYDQGLVLRLVTAEQVSALLRRAGRHPGPNRLGELVAAGHDPAFTRSEPERAFLRLVRDGKLPEPLVNQYRHGYEIDFLWPEAGVAVEIDSYGFHSTRRRFERDHQRDAALRRHGIVTIRISWRQLRDEPLAVLALVAAAVSEAAR